jgi:putative ABC transport system permease protein
MSTALTPKPFPESARDRIAKLPHVNATCGLFVEFMSIEKSQMMMLSAREWDGFSWTHLKLVSGRMPIDGKEKAVVLGTVAAEVLKKKAGDTIAIEAEELTVTGIVDGGALVENGCVIVSLALYQEISGNQGKVNVIDLRAAPNTTDEQLRQLCTEIDKLIPEARAMMISQHLKDSQGYRMILAMSWGTSLLAVVVGVFGVMNTMLMAVFERTHEICILLAVGWKKQRVVRMILLESALLGLLGGIFGVLLGAVGVKLLQYTPAIRGLLEPDLGVGLLMVSVAIAVGVGVLSGLYPAWRSSRLSPANALHG